MLTSSLALATLLLAPIVRAGDDGWVTYTKFLTTTTVSVTKYAGTSTFLSGPEFTTQTVTVSNGDAVYVEIVTAHASGYENSTSSNATTSSNSSDSSSTSTDVSSGSDSSTSSESGSSSASSDSSSSASSNAGSKVIGASVGALAAIAIALL